MWFRTFVIAILSLVLFSCRIKIPDEIMEATDDIEEVKAKLDQCLDGLEAATLLLKQCIEECKNK